MEIVNDVNQKVVRLRDLNDGDAFMIYTDNGNEEELCMKLDSRDSMMILHNSYQNLDLQLIFGVNLKTGRIIEFYQDTIVKPVDANVIITRVE